MENSSVMDDIEAIRSLFPGENVTFDHHADSAILELAITPILAIGGSRYYLLFCSMKEIREKK